MKLKVLFIREKWAGSPADGLSDGDGMIRCFESLKLGEAVYFYYDEWMNTNNGQKPDTAAMMLWARERPDLVVFTHLLQIGERNVSKLVYQTMRNAGTKVVAAWHEGVAPDVVRVADEHADCVDFNLFLDTQDQFLIHSKRPEKCFGLYDPRDAEAFSSNGATRDIPVSFLGTMVRRPVRCSAIYSLLGSGIPVATITGTRNLCQLGQVGYASILRRSLIALNFSDAANFRHYKGRVAESCLSGAMLMELENPETPKIMREYIDYVPFKNEKELFDKTIYYLNHEQERAAIAESGMKAAKEKLNGEVFWNAVFERIGIVSEDDNDI